MTTEKDVEEFGEAFDEADAATNTAEAEEFVEQREQPDKPEAKAPQGEESQSEADQDGQGDADASADEGAEADEEDIHEKYKALEHKTRSWEGRLSAAARENAELKRRLQEIEEAQKQDTGKDGPVDEANDPKFEEEYPEIASSVKEIVKSQLAPVQRFVETVQERQAREAEEAHWSALRAAHPDVDAIAASDELDRWVSSHPTYIAEAMKRVIAVGSTSETIDLLSRYKQETAKKPDVAKKQADATRKRAQAAEAVRPGVSPAPKMRAAADDFDAAWDEAP